MKKKFAFAAVMAVHGLMAGTVSVPCSTPPQGFSAGQFGAYCIDNNGSEIWGTVDAKRGSSLYSNVESPVSIGAYDVDPFFDLNISVNSPGSYTFTFAAPYAGGPYNALSISGTGSVNPSNNGVTISNLLFESLLDGAFTGQILNFGDTSAPSGGPSVTIPLQSGIAGVSSGATGSYGVRITFDLDIETGSVDLSGRAELLTSRTAIPEPATFALAAIALVGIALTRRGSRN